MHEDNAAALLEKVMAFFVELCFLGVIRASDSMGQSSGNWNSGLSSKESRSWRPWLEAAGCGTGLFQHH